MTNTVTSALGVRIETGKAASELLELQKGLEGAATGVAKLGREIQNHAGNIQKVLGEFSKHGFGGLSRSISQETRQVETEMDRLERTVSEGGRSAGRKFSVSFSTALSSGIKAATKSAGGDLMTLVSQVEGVSQQMQATLRANGIKTAAELKSEEAAVRTHAANVRAFREGITAQRLTQIADEETKVKAFREGITAQRLAQIADEEAKVKAFREGILAQRLAEIDREERAVAARRAKYVGGIGTMGRAGGAFGTYATALNTQPLRQARDSIDAMQSLDRQMRQSVSPTDASGQALKRWSDEAKVAHDAARGAAAGVGYLWMTWGNIGAMAAGFTAVRGMAASVKEAAEVEVLLTKASREAGVEFDAMREKMMSLYSDGVTPMMTGPKEVAQQLKDLVYAGFSASEAFDMLTVSLKFAEVGELEASEAAQVLQQTIHAFGLSGKDAGRVADVLAKAAASSATDVGAMASAMRQAVTVGALYNASVEDTATSLAVLAKAGIEGSAAGTALKRFMDELASPKTNKSREAIKALGIEVFTVENGIRKLKPLAGIVDEMRGKLQGLSKTDAKAFFDLVDRMQDERGKKFFSLAVKMDQTEWDEFKKTVDEDSAGFVDTLYKALSETTKGTFKQVIVQLRASMQEAMQEIDQPLKDLGQSLLTLVTSTGFKEFLRDSITLLASATSFLAEHGRQVLAVVAAYKSFQIASGLVHILIGRLGALAGVMAALRAGGVAGALAGVGTFGKTVAAVARGTAATTTGLIGLRGALMMLGGPLGIIAGLLTAGATLWAIWGNAGETAAKKAKSALDDTKAAAEAALKDFDKLQKYGDGNIGLWKQRESEITQQIDSLRSKKMSRDDAASVVALSLERNRYRDAIARANALAAKEKADREKAAETPAVVKVPGLDTDKGAEAEALRLAKETLEGRVSLAKKAGEDLLDTLKHQQALGLLSEVEYNEQAYRAKQDALLKEYMLYVDHYEAMKKLGKTAEAQDALNKVNTASAAMGRNSQEYGQTGDLIRKRETDDVAAQAREYEKANRSNQFERSMRGVDEWLRGYYSEQDKLINDLQAKIEGAKRSGKEYSAEAQAAMWANLRAHLEGLWTQSEQMSPERIEAMLSQFNAGKGAKAQELEAQVSLGKISKATGRSELNRYIAESGKSLKDMVGTDLDGFISKLGLSAAEAAKLKAELAGALAEIEKAGKTAWFDGLLQGFEDYSNSVSDIYSSMADVSANAFKSMEDALVDYVMTGKLNFKSLADSIIKDLVRIAIQQSVTKPLAEMGGSMLSSAGSWAMGLFAQGGAFTGLTGLSAYTNQVVNRPTLFAFAQGVGLVGEKPGSPGEAIMPLTRDSSGDLGVKAVGAGGGVGVVDISITINDNRTQSETTTSGGDDKVAPKLAQRLKDTVRATLVEEMRPGGLLA